MVPYFLLLFLVCVCGILGSKFKSNIYLIIISVLFALYSGFRYNIGVDYPNYVKIFNGVRGYSTNEFGFDLLIQFIKSIGGTAQLLFLILAVLMQFLVHKIITYYSPNIWISSLVFLCVAPFYLATFNGTRQYIAIAIFLYTLRFLDSKAYLKYILLNLMGVMFFHQSLLIIFPLVPFLNKKLSLNLKFGVVLGLLMFNFVIEMLISYTSYGNYLDVDKKVEISKATYGFLLILFPIVLFEKKINDFKFKTILVNLNFLCFLTLILVFIQSKDVLVQMFLRLNSYFFFSYIVLGPALVNSIQNKNIRYAAYILLLIAVLLYYFTTIVFSGEQYELVPYEMNLTVFE